MAYYLAVDAGGSKTEFLLAEEDRELGRALTGTIKRVNADAERPANNLRDALAELERTTGVRMSAVSRTCVGTSGNTVPLVTDWLREGFAQHVAGPLLLVGDVEIALDAAFFGGRGVLALAGTGSNVAARTPVGRSSPPAAGVPSSRTRARATGSASRACGGGFWRATKAGRPDCWKRRDGCGTCPRWTLSSSLPTPSLRRATDRNSRARWWPAPIGAIRWRRRFLNREARPGLPCGLLIERMRAMEGDAFQLPAVAFAGSILAKVERMRTSIESLPAFALSRTFAS